MLLGTCFGRLANMGFGSHVDTKVDSVPLFDVYQLMTRGRRQTRVCAKVSMMPRQCTLVKVYERYFLVFL